MMYFKIVWFMIELDRHEVNGRQRGERTTGRKDSEILNALVGIDRERRQCWRSVGRPQYVFEPHTVLCQEVVKTMSGGW
jgi:hypothetical protein